MPKRKINKYAGQSGNNTAVWFSSHEPHNDQREVLEGYGYDIVHIDPHHSIKSSQQAEAMITEHLLRKPALVVAIMPQSLLYHFARDMSPIPVLYPEMRFERQADGSEIALWTGVYAQITGMRITTALWLGVAHDFKTKS